MLVYSEIFAKKSFLLSLVASHKKENHFTYILKVTILFYVSNFFIKYIVFTEVDSSPHGSGIL